MRRRKTLVIAGSLALLLSVGAAGTWALAHPTAPRATNIDQGESGIVIVTTDRGALAPAPPDFEDGVLGTAEFEPNEAGASGRLSFVLDHGQLIMRVDSLSLTPLDSYDIRLLAVRVDPSERCVDSGYHETVSTGAPELGQTEFRLGSIDEYWNGDPTYLDAAVISQHVEGSSCLLDRIAYAPIQWPIGRTLPTIDIDDSAPAVGAMGEIFPSSGVPLRYRIAADDTMTAIASRLGVSDAELAWLNPRLLYPVAGRYLNLDPLNR